VARARVDRYFKAVLGHEGSVYTFPCLIQVRHILQHDHIKYQYSVTTISAFKIHWYRATRNRFRWYRRLWWLC